MNRNEKDKIRELQVQWYFVVIAALLTLFFGVAINALYDILSELYSKWWLFVVPGLFGLVFVDIFTYFFENVDELRSDPDESFLSFLWRYCKMRFGKIFRKR